MFFDKRKVYLIHDKYTLKKIILRRIRGKSPCFLRVKNREKTEFLSI
jgi:hypothetical protein